MSKGDFSGIKKKKIVSSEANDFIGAAKIDGGSKKLQPQKLKRLNVELPEELYTALKVKAAQERTKLRPLIEKWVNEYLRI